MIEYTFQEGVPEGFTFDFEVGIFHDPRHLLLQSLSGWHAFSLTDIGQRLVVGIVHVHLQSNQAVSPFRSPFGSFLFSKSISEKQLITFITKVEEALKNKGVHSISLKNKPSAYSKEATVSLEDVLLKLNYQQQQEEISSIIQVDDRNFIERLHRSKKARLKKCYELSLCFSQPAHQEFEKVYAFLKRCREEKGYALSMQAEDLKRVMDTFPDRVYLHTVSDNDNLVSACLSIRTEQKILYTFYYDHTNAYDDVSPVVLLMEGVYQFCQEQEISLLDLGTSHADGSLSQTLLDFKLSLGAQPSPKCTFVKKFL